VTAPPDGVAGTEPPPGLTVVVLNYRNAAATLRCLDAVLASSYDGALRVTVVENGSADGSADRLAAYARRAGGAVDLVASARNLGFAGGVAGGRDRIRLPAEQRRRRPPRVPPPPGRDAARARRPRRGLAL
jgi:glycosyltransferase involved in cell wall biosynthesis